MKEFVKTLSKINYLILLDTYAAGEKEIKGASSKDIYLKVQKNNKNVKYIKNIKSLQSSLDMHTTKKNTIIFMGAGSITNIAKTYMNNNE